MNHSKGMRIRSSHVEPCGRQDPKVQCSACKTFMRYEPEAGQARRRTPPHQGLCVDCAPKRRCCPETCPQCRSVGDHIHMVRR